MSFLPQDKKYTGGKRHSLATLTEIWNKHQSSSSASSSSPRTGQHHHHHHHQHHPQNYANRVSSTFTNLIGSSNSIHSDTPVQQGSLPTIQDAVIHVFQRKALPYSYYTLQSNLRRLIRTDTGPIIYDFFKDKLLKKGMVILRESLKSLKGAALLDKLSETWDYFFKEILLTLQAILYPFQDCPPEDVTISLRQLILADFRDTVLLKINLDVEEALEMTPVVPEPIKQMVLVLQGINDGISFENQLKLERIVVRTVYPYLGVRGLYENGETEPTIEAATAANISAKETEASKILLNALVHGRNATLLSLGSSTTQRGGRYEVLSEPAPEQVQCAIHTGTGGRKRLWPTAQSRHLSPSSKYSLPYSERRQVVSMTTQLYP